MSTSKLPALGFVRLLMRVIAAGFFMHSVVVLSAPGAHGPNGEHLDMDHQKQLSENPKFENFTEAFELLGEVLPERVHLYLHDFSSNMPVSDATVELEIGELSAEALYDATVRHYIVNDSAVVSRLNQPGEHEIVITIFTEDNGDLLAASLLTPQPHTDSEYEDHHHELEWTVALLSSALLVAGVAFGRLSKGKRV